VGRAASEVGGDFDVYPGFCGPMHVLSRKRFLDAAFPRTTLSISIIDARQRTEVILPRWPLARDCEQDAGKREPAVSSQESAKRNGGTNV